MKKAETDTDKTTNAAPTEPVLRVEPAALTAAQLDDLKARASKADENWDRLLRTTADFENFKKRAARDRLEAVRFANEALIEKLVPVLDNFDMALAAAKTQAADSADSFQAGIAMIHQQFKKVLSDAGLEEIDALGQTFDPNWHEAVSQRETTDAPDDQVVQQLRRGYKLRERLLRPAAVIVARKPAEPPPA
jgi:molecular chaperone GrpE